MKLRKRQLEQRRQIEAQIDAQMRGDADPGESPPNRRERRSAIKRARARSAK